MSKSCIPFPKKLSVPLFQAYNSKNPRRAHSLLLSNGGMLNYYKFPSKLEKIPNDLQFIYNPISLKYAKRQEDNKEEYTITEVPVDVCITEFHYYILHRDALTVISIITEKVVNFFNVMTYCRWWLILIIVLDWFRDWTVLQSKWGYHLCIHK